MEKLRLDANKIGSFTVTSNRPGVNPIKFQSRSEQCVSGRESGAIRRQHKHEICLQGTVFIKEHRLKRHRRHSRMSSSITDWKPMNVASVAKKTGLLEDTLDPLNDQTSNLSQVEGEEVCLDDENPDEVDNNEIHKLSLSRYHSLSRSAFCKVTSHVSSFYYGCSDKGKVAVGTIMIKTRDMIVTKGKVNTTIAVSNNMKLACEPLTLPVQRPPLALIAGAS